MANGKDFLSKVKQNSWEVEMTEINPQIEPFSSTAYWRERYRSCRNSGRGSYGRLAVYKAHEVNWLVHRKKIRSVIDLGSGDGANTAHFAVRD